MDDSTHYTRRVWIAVGIAAAAGAAAGLLVAYPYIPLMVFAAVLGGVAIDGVAGPLARRLPLPLSRPIAVGAVAVTSLVLLAGAVALSGPRIAEQSQELLDRLPEALNRVERLAASLGFESRLLPTDGGEWDAERLAQSLTNLWQPIAGVFATALAAASGMLLVAVVALFLAVEPGLYRGGLLSLAGPRRRARCDEVLSAMARALRWWLVGRISSMAVVGILTFAGLALLGVPLAGLLGAIAGALSFVPYLGPVFSAVPAVLVGLAESPTLALWTALLYAGVQLVEGNFITPMIQSRAVSLPPALLIFAQLLMGGLFGVLGVLVATPLAVVAIVSIQMLYVRDVLGEDVRVMGDHHSSQEGDPTDRPRAARTRS